MPINYSQLKTFIETDPKVRGFSSHISAGSDAIISDMLNQVRGDVSVQLPYIEVGSVSGYLMGLIDTNTRKNKLRMIIDLKENLNEDLDNIGWSVERFLISPHTPFIDLFLQTSQDLLDGLVLAGILTSAERVGLEYLQKRNGSDVEEMFGIGTIVTHTDVAIALRGI